MFKSFFSFKTSVRCPQILITLAMLYVSIDITCNVLVYKLVKLGIFLQTGGIFFYPLVFLISDIIAEIYGFRMARFVMILDLVLNLLVAAGILLVINFPSPSGWQGEPAYQTVLGHLLWLNISVIVGVIAGGLLNIFMIVRMKVLLRGRYFWLRSILSSIVGETVMLIITIFMLFHNSLGEAKLWQLIASDYSFRCIYAIIGAFPASILINIFKKYENDFVDQFNFNPFLTTNSKTQEQQ